MSIILFILLIGCVGYIIILKFSFSSLIKIREENYLNSESDRQYWSHALLREIGNELISRDRQFYLDQFKDMFSEWQELKSSGKEELIDRSNEICKKFPMYSDFDYLQTWPHVIYPDAFIHETNDELWRIYKAIKFFHAIKLELDDTLIGLPSPFNENEKNHLKEYFQTLENTEMLANIHQAKDTFNLLRDNEVEYLEGDWIYETRKYKFKRVYHYSENRVGVYIKDIKKYGMWSWFVDDESKVYRSFYSTNERFEEQENLKLNSLICRYSLAKEY